MLVEPRMVRKLVAVPGTSSSVGVTARPGKLHCYTPLQVQTRDSTSMGMSMCEVVGGGVVFGVVICKIMGSALPIEAELILCFAATEPVQSEPNHFGFALDDGVMEKSGSCRIVGLYRSLRLGPSHFFERCAKGD